MTLGGVQLSDNIILDGLENSPPVAHSQQRTIGGVSVVQTAPMVGGRELVLVSENHLTLAQVDAIRAVAMAGQAVMLVHPRGTFSVLIVGIDVSPAFPHSDAAQDDWYSGKITMIEV